ncbi:hypothetical protein AV530_016478 [Patagioenas fasciata monilis]|uniref:Uncharacterized protein n=1 Tax=Patagioenas fasciata monilis TaxID=372326 RepID=A0A1V4J2L3_PATFA|nr:hypothetical protein AV530_016478 [Patagioenas fasciata monilis]
MEKKGCISTSIQQCWQSPQVCSMKLVEENPEWLMSMDLVLNQQVQKPGTELALITCHRNFVLELLANAEGGSVYGNSRFFSLQMIPLASQLV